MADKFPSYLASSVEYVTEKLRDYPPLAGFIESLLREAMGNPKLLLAHAQVKLAESTKILPDPDLFPLGKQIVSSYSFDKKSGFSDFRIPAQVSDYTAMRAVNEYFERKLPDLSRTHAICPTVLEWCQTRMPHDMPGWRQYDSARDIRVCALVKGTGKDQDGVAHIKALERAKLEKAHPVDVILAAGLHACKHKGADLLQGAYVDTACFNLLVATHEQSGVWLPLSHLKYRPDIQTFIAGSAKSERRRRG
jgi:hypothetical protein